MAFESKEHLQKVNELIAWLKGDGCTGAPDLWYKHCCDEHDIAYRLKTDENFKSLTRLEADNKLFACMQRHSKTWIGRWIISSVYWIVVRLLGWIPYGKAR